jgi:L-alanine-DL-glutamate epimerase-like enolase superfamily enzyme
VHDLAKKNFEIKNGKMRVPKEPGLGVEINEKVLSKVRIK